VLKSNQPNLENMDSYVEQFYIFKILSRNRVNKSRQKRFRQWMPKRGPK